MSRYQLRNTIRFPLALLVGMATGLIANGIVNNGAFFVGGMGLGTVIALWLIRLAETLPGARSRGLDDKDDPPR
jgi:hypothetical protein